MVTNSLSYSRWLIWQSDECWASLLTDRQAQKPSAMGIFVSKFQLALTSLGKIYMLTHFLYLFQSSNLVVNKRIVFDSSWDNIMWRFDRGLMKIAKVGICSHGKLKNGFGIMPWNPLLLRVGYDVVEGLKHKCSHVENFRFCACLLAMNWLFIWLMIWMVNCEAVGREGEMYH